MDTYDFLDLLLNRPKNQSIGAAMAKEKVNSAKRSLLKSRTVTNTKIMGGQGGSSLLSAASGEVGTDGGINGANKYNDFKSRAWCGDFVNYAAKKAGISLPGHTSVSAGLSAMQKLGRYHSKESGYVPKSGDIVYFNWQDGGNIYDHVGIVEGFDGENLYTIEGNTSGGKVARKTRKTGAVIGYATP